MCARPRAYAQTPGAWTVARAGSGEAVGMVTIGQDHRCDGRAELSYQLLPAAWGQGLGHEAVKAAVGWWTSRTPAGGPLVAVTQKANTPSRRLLEAVGMVLVDEFEEHGATQCLYTPNSLGEDTELRWTRLASARQDERERRHGVQARATPEGQRLPEDLAALTSEELGSLCLARHGAHGRICARDAGHTPELHVGRAADGAWIAWLTSVGAGGA
ncbi:GNAT family N-acetyltransferase (plasmid) [Streptomyces sp. NBC_01304]|nr:GNAT family N-acetyltransferase [Streptomyces sp. NBC_01304]